MTKKENKQIIYFILDENANTLKIGITQNIANRLSNLRSSNSSSLKLLLYLKTWRPAYIFENEFHVYFKNLNIRGEWFKFDTVLKRMLFLLHKDIWCGKGDNTYKIGYLDSCLDGEDGSVKYWNSSNHLTSYLNELINR